MPSTTKQCARPTISTAKQEPDGKGVLKVKRARAEPPKIKPAARKDFGYLTPKAALGEPKPLVATMTGYHGLKFVLPLGLDPQGPPNVERNFKKRYRRYHRRLHRAGTIQGWLALTKLCRTKSRLVAALCLAFTGPVCGAFGYKAPGLQLSGGGATTIGRLATTVWGGEVAYGEFEMLLPGDRRFGSGVIGFRMRDSPEVVAAAFNQMLLFLHLIGWSDQYDAVIELMNGSDGQDRGTRTQRPLYRVPLLIDASRYSSKNEALVDGIIDISVPFRWRYLLEGVSTPRELRALERELNLLGDNFGWAGPEFVRRLTRELEGDQAGEQTSRSSMRAIADELRQKYSDQAADIQSRGGRDLTLITDQFATIYAAGCLANRFKVLPFTETEVRMWLLLCQRDNVAWSTGSWARWTARGAHKGRSGEPRRP
jgi:hypothetical protein